MNRAQRRQAKYSKSVRPHFLEVCLDGCCDPVEHDFAPTHPLRTDVTDDGDVNILCPWCTAPVSGARHEGDSWHCNSCGAAGLLVRTFGMG